MYWTVGEYLSGLCANSAFGDKVIDEVAAFIAKENPGVKGFTRRVLYRMKQFFVLSVHSTIIISCKRYIVENQVKL